MIPPESELRKYYYEEKATLDEMASSYDVDVEVIRAWFDEYGIDTKSREQRWEERQQKWQEEAERFIELLDNPEKFKIKDNDNEE